MLIISGEVFSSMILNKLQKNLEFPGMQKCRFIKNTLTKFKIKTAKDPMT